MIVNMDIHASERISFAMDLDPARLPDQALIQYIEHRQYPEPEVVNAMARLVRPGDLVIDGGANMGFFTLLLSRLVGPTGKVIAVEPGRNNLPGLYRNLYLNDVTNVEVAEKALAESIGARPFYQHTDGGLNSLRHGGADLPAELVDTTTLDALSEEKAPSFVKLDIEGGEMAALTGARYLRSTDYAAFIVEMNNELIARAGANPTDFRYVMGDHRDAWVLHDDGRLPSLVPAGTVLKSSRQNANILFASHHRVAQGWPEVTI